MQGDVVFLKPDAVVADMRSAARTQRETAFRFLPAPSWLRALAAGTSSGRHAQTYNTRVQSKVRSLANLAAASATCEPVRGRRARRSDRRRRGAHPPQDAGVHLRPRLRPAHGHRLGDNKRLRFVLYFNLFNRKPVRSCGCPLHYPLPVVRLADIQVASLLPCAIAMRSSTS